MVAILVRDAKYGKHCIAGEGAELHRPIRAGAEYSAKIPILPRCSLADALSRLSGRFLRYA
jgi:hypothetical protein